MMSHSQNNIHFFKVILERSIRDGELQVPRSFVKRHWQGISTAVSLRLPNGTDWRVYWLKRDGDVYFRNGWKEFAEHLSLEVSQIVLFGYEGNSCFNVIVLGKSALEIDYPPSKDNNNSTLVVKKNNSTLDQEEECEEVHESDYVGKGKNGNPSSPSPSKKMKTCPNEEHASVSNAENGNSGSSDKELKKRIDALIERVENCHRHGDSHSFICAIRKSYMERDLLIIPQHFARQHLHKMEGEMVTLFVDNKKERTWDVELKFNSFTQLTFANGWRKFLRANNLKLGDVCAFVLNNISNRVSLKVVIYPLEKYTSTRLFHGLSQRHSSSLKTPKTSKVESKYMSKDGFNINIKLPILSSVAIPFKYIKNFVSKSDHGKSVTLRVGNKKWTVKFLYYPHFSSARFSLGWPEFVNECDLQNGDVCHFKMIDEKNLELQVTIN